MSEIIDMFWEDSKPKQMIITFSDGDVITNSDLESESFTLKESLCTGTDLQFGEPCASEVSFPIRNINRTKIGQAFTVDIKFDNANVYRLGVYKVQSDKPTADRTKREIVAYDALYDAINADVTTWYNTILPNSSSTTTVKAFRDSFAEHFSIIQATQTLVNDSITIKRTIEPTKLSGRDVLAAIGEINGAFPHIGRDGLLYYKTLKQGIQGLYPSDTLFPGATLYPRDSSATFVSKAHYIPPLKYEDYTVRTIDGIRINSQEGNGAASVGSTNNVYVVSANFLCYGKTNAELQTIATNMLSKISSIIYRPFEVTSKGNPCIEVGDAVRMNTSAARVESYVFQRTLTGIQSLRDSFVAPGNEYRSSEVNTISSQLKQIAGKTASLNVNVDSIEGRVEDIEDGSASVIQQLSNGISLKVSKTDIVSDLDSQMSGITIQPNKIAVSSTGTFTVDSTNFKLSENGTATLINATIQSFDDSLDKIEISNGAIRTEDLVIGRSGIGWKNSQNILSKTTLQIGDVALSDEGSSSSMNGLLLPSNYGIYIGASTIGMNLSGKITIDNSEILTANSTIDGSKVTEVSAATYASSAGSALTAGNADSATSATNSVNAYYLNSMYGSTNSVFINNYGNFVPSATDTMRCGGSSAKWTDVWATNGTIQTSDERDKQNITELTDAHLRFIKGLIPKSFQFKHNTSRRTHIGFIAQEVEALMAECGLTSLDFAGLIKDPVYDADGNIIDYIYGLRYTEFISLVTYAWQQTDKKLDNLIDTLQSKGVL